MPTASVGGAGPAKAVPGAGWALALLLGINLFNYIDRQILSATLPKIRLDATIFRPDDPWAQTKLGALTTAFMVVVRRSKIFVLCSSSRGIARNIVSHV